MTRSDYLTIAIVGACLVALVILIIRFSRISDEPAPLPIEPDFPENFEDTLYQDTLDDPYAYTDTLPLEEADVSVPADAAAPKTGKAPKPAVVPDVRAESAPRLRSSGDYLVLAGSFRYKDHAEAAARQLRKKGYSGAKVELFNRGAFANVLVDRFDSYSEAQALVVQLRNDGVYDAYVHRKR
jgi:cell division protein FtsN